MEPPRALMRCLTSIETLTSCLVQPPVQLLCPCQCVGNAWTTRWLWVYILFSIEVLLQYIGNTMATRWQYVGNALEHVGNVLATRLQHIETCWQRFGNAFATY